MIKKNIKYIIILLIIFLPVLAFNIGQANRPSVVAENLNLDEQEATIRAIKKVTPSVVSIIVYQNESIATLDLSTGAKTFATEKVEMGSGTGFIISSEGLIMTNKHVVNSAEESKAIYNIILSDGRKQEAKLIGKDPINDLAVLQIEAKGLPAIEMGDSDRLEIGASVIAIGNSLGRYQNSATKGIVSGLGRSIIASDLSGNTELLDNVIQTDAEINLGNSGGPLINLYGQVIGVNVAIDKAGEAIGFAIPINDVKPVVASVKNFGTIKRVKLGVRYLMITPDIIDEYGLNRHTGALIIAGDSEVAVQKDSPAWKAGLQDGDIIFEINAIKIEGKNTLLSVIQKYKAGDRIGLKIQRAGKILIKTVVLEEFK